MTLKVFSNPARVNGHNHLRFGPFELDRKQRLLFREGREIILTPKALDVLEALAAKPGEVVAKQELMRAVWPDTFVEEATLTQHIFTIRKALGEEVVETVPKRGYRLAGATERQEPKRRPYRWIAVSLAMVLVLAGFGWGFLRTRTASYQRVEATDYLVRGREMLRQSGGGGVLTALNSSSLAAALAMFERARDADPSFAEPYAWIGMARYQRFANGIGGASELAQARASALKALELDPALAAGHRAMVRIAHSTGETADAVDRAWRLLHAGHRDRDTVEAAVEASFRAGLIPESILLWKRALPVDPMNTLTRVSLARSQFHALQHREGIATLDPLADNPDSQWVLAQLYEQIEDRSKACDAIRRVVETAPNQLAGWYEAARIFVWAGRREEAWRLVKPGLARMEALLEQAHNARTLIFAALTHGALGDRARAKQHLDEALRTGSNDPWNLYQGGLVLATIGEDAAAIEMLGRSAERGWFGSHYVTRDESPHRAFHHLRGRADYEAARRALFAKTETLRNRYPLPKL